MNLATKTAIVTGAGRGIGRATALALARHGAQVGICARTEAQLRVTADAIVRAGAAVVAVVADVAKAEDVERFAKEVDRLFGAPDFLVNNAGVVARAALHETEEATWDAVVGSNLKGAYLCTRAFLPGMIERGSGRIVNVSSIAGRRGSPMLAAYSAAKWGLVGLTKSLAREVFDRGVQVNAIAPGSVDTEMLRQGAPERRPDMTAEEVAEMIVYLLARAPPALTGSVIDLFGPQSD